MNVSEDDFKQITSIVTAHDKQFSLMAQSVEALAKNVGSTNRKLEDIISVISTQNVLMEKFTNLESNLKESFDRIHIKIRDIEQVHHVGGCSVVSGISKDVESLADQAKGGIRPALLKSIIIAIVGYSIVFGAYIEQRADGIEKIVLTHDAKQIESERHILERVSKNELFLNRNYGLIKGSGKRVND